MAASAILTSTQPLLSLLDEPEPELQIHALEQLNTLVDHFWSEIGPSISKIEILYEDDSFSQRELAACVASKVFYHLEELDDAMRYALVAGNRFDLSTDTEYVRTLAAKCIDEYVSIQQQTDEKAKAAKKAKVDFKLLEAVVERMFQRCMGDGQFKQAVGIALDARRLDLVKEAVNAASDSKGMLAYLFKLAQTVVANKGFRLEVLQVLIDMYKALASPDYVSMCQCFLFLDDHDSVASILHTMVEKAGSEPTSKDLLMAYQVAFDLNENQNQPFLNKVIASLPVVQGEAETKKKLEDMAAKDAEEKAASAKKARVAAAKAAKKGGKTEAADVEMKSAEDTAKEKAAMAAVDAVHNSHAARMVKLKRILSGEVSVELYLQFLYSHNKSDLNIMKEIKDRLEARNSVTHNAAVTAHAIMHCGTTVDTFIRDNMEWLGSATNWAKFSATASIGILHKGHHKQSMKIMEPFLPNLAAAADNAARAGGGAVPSSSYDEGGALYALGLIHANQGGGDKDLDRTEFLMAHLKAAGDNEVLQHGACLGIGLTAMATGNEEVYEVLKAVLMTDNAVAGEAAGYAIGLVLLGSGHEGAVEELVEYAHNSMHEKIIRAIGLAMALVSYGREENADSLIETLLRDKDPILRYGGCYAVALAYVATANNDAIQKLLHVAVSDVSDDVRRAAVAALGLVLANVPEQVPRIVSLLSESYNPHVRYGSCLAVAAACASSGMPSAIALIEPLLKDKVDYVRQGAMLAMSMVLLQHNDTLEPKVKEFRDLIGEAQTKKGDTMTKLGAILAAGILDAGGRNVNISLLSPAGHKKIAAIVGMTMFPQFWNWYPLMHFISLCFSPTAVIGLNQNLKMPVAFKFVSNSPASMYAYPAPVEIKKAVVEVQKKANVLSVTMKKKKRNRGDDVDMMNSSTASIDSTMEVDKEEKEGEKEEKKEEAKAVEDAPFLILENPARVTLRQQKKLLVGTKQRYVCVKETLSQGVVMLADTTPSETEEIVKFNPPTVGVAGIDADEPDPPAPFQFSR